MAEQDLTGIWQGLYSYGGLGDHVGFTATLIDSGGALYGSTHERDPHLAPTSLEASLSGRRRGRRVSFTKIYEAQDEHLLPIAYEGSLSGDGTELEGTWEIRSPPLSGRFLMSRPPRRAAEAEVGETVRA